MIILNQLLSMIILCIFVILGLVLPYRDGNSLWSILGILWLLVGPAKFCYLRKYKKNNTLFYQILLFVCSIVILFFSLFSRTELSFWIIYGILILIFLFNLFMKRESYIRERDISKTLLFITGVCASAVYFSDIYYGYFGKVIGVSISIFSFLLLFLNNHSNKELRVVYFILAILSLVIKQPVCLILFIQLFLDLDYFGINY